jgi:flagellar biosynthesis/type III secretory pathway chaperone
MEKESRQLLSILEKQSDLHNDLIKIAENMNKAIKKNDINKIHILTSQFDEYTGQIDQMETKRLELCDKIALISKSKLKHLTLQQIIQLLPGNYVQSFIQIKTELKQKILDLKKINSSNQILLNESLLLIKKDFEFMAKIKNKLNGYGQNGKIDTKTTQRNIVNHIA